MNTLLELLEQDCTQSNAQLAAQAGMTEAEVAAERARLEEDGAILGYQAIIDWDRVKRENVTALIEVKVVPQSIDGFPEHRRLRPHRRADLPVRRGGEHVPDERRL